MSTMLDDLFSATPNVSLFLPAPSGSGFVPNVVHTSDIAFQMLELVGIVMGIAFRHAVRALCVRFLNVFACSQTM
jgi:hypothetical protein